MMLTKEDFVGSHAVSVQVEAAKINPAIAEALLLDVRPALSHQPDLLDDALSLAAFTVQEWPVVLAEVLPGQYVQRRERVYKALMPTPEGDVPTAARSTEEWQYDPLRTFWHTYLRPYWKQAAFCRFLPTHGINLEKAGIVTPADSRGTVQPVSAQRRAELQAAADHTAGALLNRLLRYVRDAYPGSGTSPCTSTPHRRRQRIRGI